MVEVSGITIFHIAENGHRTPYFPGMDLTAAPQEVLDAVAVHWTEEAVAAWREANQSEPAPPPTDWDGLNNAILSNAEFNAVYGAVMQSHPLIAAALPAALTQVATGQTTMFSTVYSQMCAVAEVTPAQRDEWAIIAEGFYAPDEFVAVVRG